MAFSLKKKDMPRADPDGDVVKEWETKTPNQLPSNQWTVLRLDGHCFHTYTRPFNRPHDIDLCHAMVNTTVDLCKRFNAVTGYTQSDEITLLLLPNIKTKICQPLLFNGRKQKFESLSAGYASARFNHHMNNLATNLEDKHSDKYLTMTSGEAYFDSRAITVASSEDAIRIFKWRYEFDCFKNGISALAHYIFTPKELYKKSTRAQMCMLSSMNVDIFGDYPASLFYGTFVKKRLIQKMCQNHKTKALEPCIRTEYVKMSIPTRPFPENFHSFITCAVLD